MSVLLDRVLPPTKELFRRVDEIPEDLVAKDEGTPVRLKLLMVTPDMHCVTITREKGALDPKRSHDHSTVCCLLSGKLRLHIGTQTFVAEPGDVWMYPQGVPHQSEALEDSSQLEVAAPACKTW